jgi:quercetin dioxygenase-like cupin family protein
MTAYLSASEVETISINGNTIRVLDDGVTTDGRIGIVESVLDPGWPGPPQHIHYGQDETFFILEGNVRFTSGADTFVAHPGQLVTIPAGDPHTFGNADGDRPARLLGSVSPARYIEFFRELATLPANEDGRIDGNTILDLMKRYDTAPYH